jgi:hypothetical protein
MSEGFRAPDGPDPGESRLRFRLRQAIDALVYGVVFALVTLLVGVVVGFGLGVGWFGVELFLFVVGVALLGYASFQLRPAKRWDVEFDDDGFQVVRPDRGGVVGHREESRFQRAVQRVPPLPSLGLEPAQRLSPAAKLLVASVLVLLSSILLEAVLFW